MAEIKSAAEIGAKWARVTPTRSADYEAGVKNPSRDWSQATKAASGAWKDGIQAAIAADSFSKGVTKAGSGKWQAGAVDKGVSRWGPGVQVAESAYVDGVAPYVAAIASVKLPPRFARRDPRNMARVTAIVEALSKVKNARG